MHGDGDDVIAVLLQHFLIEAVFDSVTHVRAGLVSRLYAQESSNCGATRTQ